MEGLQLKYFVLNPRSKTKNDIYAKASRTAMRAYSDVIAFDNPELSHDLRQWVNKEDIKDEKLKEEE